MASQPGTGETELPVSFRGAVNDRWGAIVHAALVALFGLGLLILPLFAGPGLRGGGKAVVVVLGLLMIALAAFLLHKTVGVVTLTDQGVRIVRVLGSKTFRWDAISRVHVDTISRAQQRRARAGAMFGAVGGLVVAATSKDARPTEDPLSVPRARKGLTPVGSLFGANDRTLARLPTTLGWDVIDALRSQAESRGIDVHSGDKTTRPSRSRRGRRT